MNNKTTESEKNNSLTSSNGSVSAISNSKYNVKLIALTSFISSNMCLHTLQCSSGIAVSEKYLQLTLS